MLVEGLHPYTNTYAGIKEQVNREFGQRGGGWGEWFEMTQSASKDRYVKFVCKVDPAEAADLKPKGRYIFNATLEDYSDGDYSAPTALLTCTDIAIAQ